MDYLRTHIKKHGIYVYGRVIGIALLLLSLILAISIASTSLFGTIVSMPIIMLFIAILAIFSFLIIATNLLYAHISLSNLMNSNEKTTHVKHVKTWIFVILLSILLFTLPVYVLKAPLQALSAMFMFGGFLILLYLSVGGVFKHYFNEVGFGGLALWIIFAINSFYSASVPTVLVYFVTLVSAILISGIVGIALIFHSSQEVVNAYTDLVRKIESKTPSPKRKK
ncbi:MAG: hypothetical protein M1331_03630 [Candidatus Marsarchaeota archaeon]|nr:hypothetical protein [Candidatus Marsarchaeota archaeon]MCL5106458.1 hypothetical protein [Candidatus Marsarchaeota archaeon]